MKIKKTDVFFLLLILIHLVGQFVLLGSFSTEDLTLAIFYEQRKDVITHQLAIQEIAHIIKGREHYSLSDIIYVNRGRPLLFHYLMALLASLSSQGGYFLVRASVLLFSVLIFFLMYGYFRRKNDPFTGMWAILITACSPFFLRYSTGSTPHMLFVLSVFLVFILADKTDSFRDRGWSLFLGLMSGVSLFVKDEALIYCFVIYFISAIPVFMKPTKRQIGNLVFSCFLFGNFLAYFAYLYIFHEFSAWCRLTINYQSITGTPGLVSPESLLFYTRALYKMLMGPYFTSIACMALIMHFIKSDFLRGRNLIFLCVIILLIFTAIKTKHSPYIAPLIPFIAIICAQGIRTVRLRRIQGAVVIILCYLTVHAYAGPIFTMRPCALDSAQFEYGKIWDMVEKHRLQDSSYMSEIPIQVLGVETFASGYLNLRLAQNGDFSMRAMRIVSSNAPLAEIDAFANVPFVIYVSISEDQNWPTKEELWDEFIEHESLEHGVTPFDWEKVVDSKDSFVEVERCQATIRSMPLYVFLYKNRALLEDNEIQ